MFCCRRCCSARQLWQQHQQAWSGRQTQNLIKNVSIFPFIVYHNANVLLWKLLFSQESAATALEAGLVWPAQQLELVAGCSGCVLQKQQHHEFCRRSKRRRRGRRRRLERSRRQWTLLLFSPPGEN